MPTIINWIVAKLYIIPGIIIAISVHEFGHAKAAQLCGDRTGLYQGRVSLDPRAHIDPLGLVMLFLVGFGWGRPVIIDPRQFKNPRRDQIIVGLAGVFNNFVTALVVAFIYRFCYQFLSYEFLMSRFGQIILGIIWDIITINVSLMLFNLIPVPPLDGFGVVCGLFNLYHTRFYWDANRYGRIILIILLYTGATSIILRPAANSVLSLIMRIATIGY